MDAGTVTPLPELAGGSVMPNSCVPLQRRGALPTSSTTPRAGFPTGAIRTRPRRWCAPCSGSAPAPGTRRIRSWARSRRGRCRRHSATRCRDHERRRLPPGADAKSRGRRIHPLADADGADRRSYMRKEEGVARSRARSAQKPFLLSRATGVEAVSAETRRCHRAMDRRQRLHSVANPACYEKPNRGRPRSPLPQAG